MLVSTILFWQPGAIYCKNIHKRFKGCKERIIPKKPYSLCKQILKIENAKMRNEYKKQRHQIKS